MSLIQASWLSRAFAERPITFTFRCLKSSACRDTELSSVVQTYQAQKSQLACQLLLGVTTYGGEVCGVREKDRPAVADPLVEVEPALGRLSSKIGSSCTESEGVWGHAFSNWKGND